MKETYAVWMEKADDPKDIHILISVDTKKERAELKEFENVVVLGGYGKGVVAAVNALTKNAVTEPGDIIILVSDDFFPPDHWDSWLKLQFRKYHGCIVVKDGYQAGGCVTIPILDHFCFKKLNRIIYHPSYFHQYCDAELFQNLKALGMVKNLRRERDTPMFEHRHWVNGKRKLDKHDERGNSHGGVDAKNFGKRMRMSVGKRLL